MPHEANLLRNEQNIFSRVSQETKVILKSLLKMSVLIFAKKTTAINDFIQRRNNINKHYIKHYYTLKHTLINIKFHNNFQLENNLHYS